MFRISSVVSRPFLLKTLFNKEINTLPSKARPSLSPSENNGGSSYGWIAEIFKDPDSKQIFVHRKKT